MKKFTILLSLLLVLFVFGACQEGSETTNLPITTEELEVQEPTVESGYLVDNPQDGLILHAWNWSLENIEEKMEEIAIAGYSTIQISPMQPQKDYFGDASWGASWWKLYQPLGFVIATSNHSIGTQSDLESLTQAADEYGIKIIVDVIANHLSGDSSTSLDPAVEAYEPTIYQDSLIRQDNGMVSDTSIFAVTKGSMGDFPDLITESSIVQEAVLDLLKDYVDAGVDGFRFDAAKHIETPEDDIWSSDFWPTVINGIETYASDDLYIYGEILNTPGANRSYADYLPYMAITANTVSNNYRNAVATRNADALESIGYISDVPANQSVLWAESHDDYAAGHTDGLSDATLTRTYVVQASRKDATTLYFARPSQASLMGEIGSYTWQSLEVSAINRFHNYFVGADEAISIENGFFLNERFSSNSQGVVIVDVDGSGSLENLNVSHLSDGHYKDQVSGNYFVVNDGKISGDMAESGIAIVYNNPFQPKPTVYVSDDGLHTTFTDSLDLTIYSFNTTRATFSINGGEEVAFVGDIDITLTHPDANATVTLEVRAWYGDYLIEKSYTYEKSNTQIDEVVVSNINPTDVEGYTIVAWVWPQGTDGQWVEGTYSNGTFTFDLPSEHNWFLLVLFPEGTTSFDWDNKVKQTGDQQVPSDGNFDGSSLTWT